MDERDTALTGVLVCVGTVAVLLFLTPVIFALERRRLRRARARFTHGRPPLPDPVFLSRADVPAGRAAFFLAARRAMADLSGVPPEMIYPEDSWRSLMDLQFDNGFLEDIVFALERELNTPLPLAYPTDDRLPFAVIVRQLAECLEQAGAAGAEPGAAADRSGRPAAGT